MLCGINLGGVILKIFISYASNDSEVAQTIAKYLQKRGLDVWYDQWQLAPGDNLIVKINEGIDQADALLVLMSDAFASSKWAQHELSTWRLSEAAHERKVIFPVRVADAPIPAGLENRVYFDLPDADEPNLERLATALLRSLGEEEPEPPVPSEPAGPSDFLLTLRREHMSGNLCLFCGAGISIEAGIPDWNVLLRRLLTRLFRGESSVQLATAYQNQFGRSPLIVSQYLKNALGQDYRSTLRTALYADDPVTSPVIAAIRELCRPQRAGKPLHSIVTFNFDDLIENELRQNGIRCCPIYGEGQRAKPDELPVYHVHGFLPRVGVDVAEHDLVFSEDAYHSQFIDSFSWSNLAQLGHLANQTCLFVGLSMTDPNLRRLLDVAARKNPDTEGRHFVFKRRYRVDEMDGPKPETLVRMAHILEEEDANNLGLNVMWVEEYTEIPNILNEIITPSP